MIFPKLLQDVEAYNYLSVAAESGHAGALYTIGNLFLKKKSGENQEEKAYKYLQKAMELGSVAAINSLGQSFFIIEISLL